MPGPRPAGPSASGMHPALLEDRPLAGIGFVLAAFLVFSFVDAGTKWLGLLGFSVFQMSFMRYAGHFGISLGLAGLRVGGPGLAGGDTPDRRLLACARPGLVLLRAAMLAGSTVLNFLAIQYLPLSLTSTILMFAPVITCALAWPILREPVGRVRWFAVAAGFAGIVIAIRPFDADFHPAVFCSIGAALCFALYTILTRKLAGIVAIDVMQFYAGAVGTLALLPVALLVWNNPSTGFQWLVMVAIGCFGWLGHQFLTGAMRMAPASFLMPFSYSLIFFMSGWSWLVFGHIPDGATIAGAAMVILAGLVIWSREMAAQRRNADQSCRRSL